MWRVLFAGNALLSIGLVGLYATFIYTISKSLKLFTHKLLRDIMYTDMERTGFIYAKIKDVYLARKMARTCGGRVVINGQTVGTCQSNP